jgi:hypothetical protein
MREGGIAACFGVMWSNLLWVMVAAVFAVRRWRDTKWGFRSILGLNVLLACVTLWGILTLWGANG